MYVESAWLRFFRRHLRTTGLLSLLALKVTLGDHCIKMALSFCDAGAWHRVPVTALHFVDTGDKTARVCVGMGRTFKLYGEHGNNNGEPD